MLGRSLPWIAALAALSACAPAPEEAETASETSGQAVSGSYDDYAAFAARHGSAPRAGQPLVIGIRGRDLAGNVHETRVTQTLDDTLVVLTPDERVVRLAVSTHPWETTGNVPDVDGDGHGDVGMIRPGKYLAVQREASRDIGGARTYHVLTEGGADRLPGYRNTDHDDAYSADEREASDSRGDYLTAVLFHRGGEGTPPAVGCQVLDADGIRILAREGGARFDYLLVDANEEEIP
ncbi:MAG: hypothetical protein KF764_12760 [Labilithrix sp.]|nr:hypothetical protein [Labilithrix sp.]